MRLWMVPVHLMCDRHLRGEHVECHMFVGTIKKGKSIEGFVQDGLVDVRLIKKRHDVLAEEMLARGGRHESPLKSFLPPHPWNNFIDVRANIAELARRCPDCYDRIKAAGHETPFPRGGDAIIEVDDEWRIQFTGEILAPTYSSKAKALSALERKRRNITLQRQGRL